jgi:perosamine synthetase
MNTEPVSITPQSAVFNEHFFIPRGEHDFLPYGKQWIDDDDIASVNEVLHSQWLTTGPKIAKFERALADFSGAREAVAVSSGTAALHAAAFAIGIGPGDEVILPPMTFVATANAVVFQGGTPVFADIEPDTLLINPDEIEKKITPRTKAIMAVDYAGHPCDYDILRDIAEKHNLFLVADACHALGAMYRGRKTGTLADVTVFSFHPVKHITTGEGGMAVTGRQDLAERMRRFRNHGIDNDHRQRAEQGTWHYEMEDLGYNYRITDLQCALGISQLRKLDRWIDRRRHIAKCYFDAFADLPFKVLINSYSSDVLHAYHLFVVQLDLNRLIAGREMIFKALREEGIGVNVHYLPVHLHPFYQRNFGFGPGQYPTAERAYERLLSLPIFPGMSDQDIEYAIETISRVITYYTV